MKVLRLIRAALPALSALMLSPHAYAGAWPLPAGEGQIIAGILAQTASADFDENGERNSSTDYNKVLANVYIEHGLTNRWTLVANAGVEAVQIDSAGRAPDETSGLSTAQIDVRRTLWQTDNTVIAAQGGLIFAQTGENVPGATLGSGGTDYEIGALIGQSGAYRGYDIFGQVHGAYRARSKGFGDEYRLDITAGIQTHPHMQMFLQSFYVNGEEGSREFRAYERLKLQPSVTWTYNRGRRIQLGAAKTVWGENSLEDSSVFIAFWRQY